MPHTTISPVTSGNFDTVWPLILECLASYGLQEFDEIRYRNFFLQFATRKQRGAQYAYFLEGRPVGFATVYFTFSSFHAKRVAFLNDLYVTPAFRGRGCGKALLSSVKGMAKRRHVTLIQWLVRSENAAAHQFYRHFDTTQSNWVRHSWHV